jgi:dual oxidase
VATQPIEHLHCLTKEFTFATDNKPTISYWLFQTLTGFTGVLLWVVMVNEFAALGPSHFSNKINF